MKQFLEALPKICPKCGASEHIGSPFKSPEYVRFYIHSGGMFAPNRLDLVEYLKYSCKCGNFVKRPCKDAK